ncbi:GMC family oxidoreductase [Candidatus Binatia bacterium]|nr:GMC family oxidoreductase [Candidatus Binatia bacterium]
MGNEAKTYDAIIVGAGTSGSCVASALSAAGLRCLILEAGKRFARDTYPRAELDANSQLYWGGGIELNTDADIGFLRARVVGGGSIVNQALMDRFDDVALDSWRQRSGVPFFTGEAMAPWYDKAESELCLQYIPTEYRNRNAQIFAEGFAANGYVCAPLRRAQRDCRFQDGNDCIVCLSGCPIDSKQSMPVTVLRRALEAGAELRAETEVLQVAEVDGGVTVTARSAGNGEETYRAGALVLAGGAIGTSSLLLRSGFAARLPLLGRNFYSHPQYMHLAVYDDPVDAHKGPMQSLKSADPNFRRYGFKLENVYAPPVAIAMLLPGFGHAHLERMRRLRQFACIEVSVRDQNPGQVRVDGRGQTVLEKQLDGEDRARRDRGFAAVRNIFLATGAREIVEGSFGISLHLMGGCNMGTDPGTSVVSPEFKLHGCKRIYATDGSIFPDAPGINPALTIMALSWRAGEQIVKDLRA